MTIYKNIKIKINKKWECHTIHWKALKVHKWHFKLNEFVFEKKLFTNLNGKKYSIKLKSQSLKSDFLIVETVFEILLDFKEHFNSIQNNKKTYY